RLERAILAARLLGRFLRARERIRKRGVVWTRGLAVGARGFASRLARAPAALGASSRTAALVARTRVAAALAALPVRTRLVVETQRQTDSLPSDIDVEHFDLDDVAGFHDLARILHELRRQRRDVHEPVLMNADVDERAERGDVANDAFEDHAGLQVVDLLDTFGEARGLELGPRIAARLLELAQDVAYRRHAELLVGE